MRSLIIIPARGGSKGIPGKNIKLLGGKPLLHYSLEYAREFAADEDICLTTDDAAIIACAASIGYKAPFTRPASLATDRSGSYEVLQHAVSFYLGKGSKYDNVVLLQPTSPFRLKSHLEEALLLYTGDTDMVVSVNQSPFNPYYNLFEADNAGWLHVSKGDGNIVRRQDAPVVYNYNGSIYIINTESLLKHSSFSGFSRVRPYKMDAAYSMDLDEPSDWEAAEYYLKSRQS